ncbi:hypothetical protein CNEONATC25_03061 [Clostridium neonatale]|uniref:Uncharacterized protein n=1 Tax=Clostridium neonatale TaxID=137838 RepID=A0A650MHD7_9CLOT|nr:hypothetical protein CNEONATC25_03061 [Clostridium neonatale]SUQ50406.1 hypothetical protein CNEONATNEC32_03021 [Clostridium neonatale]SUQ51632.1 hypothetical protein CNEONATNEC26_02996 [Clostridium neonatale]VCT85432.1 hypothetical protein CNEONATNEC25_03033 [Clostridium neonatale]
MIVGSILSVIFSVLETASIILINNSFVLPSSAVGLYVSAHLLIASILPSSSNAPYSLIVNPPTLAGIITSITIQFGFFSSVPTCVIFPSHFVFTKSVCFSVGL